LITWLVIAAAHRHQKFHQTEKVKKLIGQLDILRMTSFSWSREQDVDKLVDVLNWYSVQQRIIVFEHLSECISDVSFAAHLCSFLTT
jgi:hypothetical protein